MLFPSRYSGRPLTRWLCVILGKLLNPNVPRFHHL